MSDYQIFSDGSCDIERNTAFENNITIIPFYVSLDQENYQKEIDELSLKEFYEAMIGKHLYPKTSLPSVQDYINAFTKTLEAGEDVLCFTITDTLSGSYQSAMTAKLMLEETYPNSKIYIVNSWLATAAQNIFVLEACRMKADGLSIDQIYSVAEKMKADSRIIFMVGALSHLEKGGRIGKIAALSGSILSIKPLIILKGGEINVAGMARSRKKGIKKLAELTKAHLLKTGENAENYIFVTGITNAWEEEAVLKSELESLLPQITLKPPVQIGATISSHTGPDTIGICFIKKYENYL